MGPLAVLRARCFVDWIAKLLPTANKRNSFRRIVTRAITGVRLVSGDLGKGEVTLRAHECLRRKPASIRKEALRGAADITGAAGPQRSLGRIARGRF